MELCFLGTGATLPSISRNVSSTAVLTDEGILLFDCGEGTQRQMMIHGVSFMKVRWIALSHFHGDHMLGLPGLLQSMELMNRKEPLNIYGPEGTERLLHLMALAGLIGPSFPVIPKSLRHSDVVALGRHRLMAVRAKHTVPALAYRLDAPVRPGRFYPKKAKKLGLEPGPIFGKLQRGETVTWKGRSITPSMVLGPPRPGPSVGYAVDTRPTRFITIGMKGVDALIFDSTFASEMISRARMTGHSTAAEAAEVAKKCGARKLYLTHISGRYDDVRILVNEARAVFSRSYAVRDGMRRIVKSSP